MTTDYNRQPDMIQRKQSIFLLLAFCAMAASFMFPIVTIEGSIRGIDGNDRPIGGELNLVAKNAPDMVQQAAETAPYQVNQRQLPVNLWPMIGITVAVAALSAASIFLYRNRVCQMRVVAVGFLLSVVNIFLLFIWAVDRFTNLTEQWLHCNNIQIHYGIGTWCLVAVAVMLFLAQRSIKKDEQMVRDADHLR